MHISHVVTLPLIFAASCASIRPVTCAAGGQVVATQPAMPQQPPKAPSPGEETAPAPAPTPAEETPPTAPPLDLKALEQRLRNTKAMGIFTKLTLKNQVDDLLDKFEDYYKGKSKYTMKDLRRSYDLLLMKVLSLLQDKDPPLAMEIVASREPIWMLLADPKAFATLRA